MGAAALLDSQVIGPGFIVKEICRRKWSIVFPGHRKRRHLLHVFRAVVARVPFNGNQLRFRVTNIQVSAFLLATMICMLPYDFALTNP